MTSQKDTSLDLILGTSYGPQEGPLSTEARISTEHHGMCSPLRETFYFFPGAEFWTEESYPVPSTPNVEEHWLLERKNKAKRAEAVGSLGLGEILGVGLATEQSKELTMKERENGGSPLRMRTVDGMELGDEEKAAGHARVFRELEKCKRRGAPLACKMAHFCSVD